MTIPRSRRISLAALVFGALLALPLTGQAQTYTDPIITPPGDSDSGDSNSGGGDEPTPPPPSGSSPTGELTDATGQSATINLDNKALQFHSSHDRRGTDLEYDPGLDSAQGGGANGGFPYWEVGSDWMVTESARCEVSGRGTMTKVAGTKERDLKCYVEWMNGGGKRYVNRAHCETGANNAKPAATKSYEPPSCPHPEWIIGAWSNWWYTGNWYRASGDRGKTCGTITEYRPKKRTRSLSCKNGTYAECLTYNGPVNTTQTGTNSRSRSLGACGPTEERLSGHKLIGIYHPYRYINGQIVRCEVVLADKNNNHRHVRYGPYANSCAVWVLFSYRDPIDASSLCSGCKIKGLNAYYPNQWQTDVVHSNDVRLIRP